MPKKPIKKIKYRVDIIWSEEDQAYVAKTPELPGCVTHGETLEEAASMAEEAIRGYVETLQALGKPVPIPMAEKKFSGEFLVRVDPNLHRDLTIKAGMEDTS